VGKASAQSHDILMNYLKNYGTGSYKRSGWNAYYKKLGTLNEIAYKMKSLIPTSYTDYYGEITHPYLKANILAMHLSEKNYPLNKEQIKKIIKIIDSFDRLFTVKLNSYNKSTLINEKIIDEVLLKTAHTKQIFNVLTYEQKQTMHFFAKEFKYIYSTMKPIYQLSKFLVGIYQGRSEDLIKQIITRYLPYYTGYKEIKNNSNLQAITSKFIENLQKNNLLEPMKYKEMNYRKEEDIIKIFQFFIIFKKQVLLLKDDKWKDRKKFRESVSMFYPVNNVR